MIESNDNVAFSKDNSNCIKGFAILIIMICHFIGTFGNGIRVFTPLGGIGVAIFLILSAYGLNESYETNGLKFWWRKRIITVFIPYAIVQTLCGYWNGFDAISYVKDITLLQPAYGYGWYLNYLLFWYIVFYVVMLIPFTRKHKIFFHLLIGCVSFVVLPELRAEQAFAFVTGLVLSDYKNQDKLKSVINWKSGSILLICGCIFLVLKQMSLIRNAPQTIFSFVQMMIKLPCGLCASFWIVSIRKSYKLKIFNFIGKISYELYLVHGYVICLVSKNVTGAIAFWLLSILFAVILSLCVSLIQKSLRKKLISTNG